MPASIAQYRARACRRLLRALSIAAMTQALDVAITRFARTHDIGCNIEKCPTVQSPSTGRESLG